MAKQESILKMRGSIGDLSFSKHRRRGYEVRTKSGVSKDRILTDPNFQRTRENMNEFGTAASKAKQIRQQLNNVSRGTADGAMGNRLMALIYRIQKRDPDSVRGERLFKPENAWLLRGFEFNSNSNLPLLFAQLLDTQFDRETGNAALTVPAFDPQVDVYLLQGATHVRFTLAAASLPDTEEMLPRPSAVSSDYIPLIGAYPGITLQVSLPAALPDLVYTVVGMSVYQQVNGNYYPLKNGLYNALTISQVDLPEE